MQGTDTRWDCGVSRSVSMNPHRRGGEEQKRNPVDNPAERVVSSAAAAATLLNLGLGRYQHRYFVVSGSLSFLAKSIKLPVISSSDTNGRSKYAQKNLVLLHGRCCVLSAIREVPVDPETEEGRGERCRKDSTPHRTRRLTQASRSAAPNGDIHKVSAHRFHSNNARALSAGPKCLELRKLSGGGRPKRGFNISNTAVEGRTGTPV